MKAISAPLLALMQSSQQFTLADLYTFTLITGAVLRYTDFDYDLTFGANTWSSSGPPMTRGKTRLVLGLEVDTLDISIFARPTDLYSGVPLAQQAAFGLFDGAEVKLERAYITVTGGVPTVVGTIYMFSGEAADTSVGRTEIKMRVNSDVAKLALQMPRNIYQPSCLHTLYDSDCTLVRASYANSLTAATGSTTSLVLCTSTQATGYFERGYIQFTSGANAGVKRTVKGSSLAGTNSQTLSLFKPLPNVPAVGDAFTAYPGCDKTQTTCQYKFGNLPHFRAFPYIPSPETSL